MNKRRLYLYLLNKNDAVHCFTWMSSETIGKVFDDHMILFTTDPFYATRLKPWQILVVRCAITDDVIRGTRDPVIG